MDPETMYGKSNVQLIYGVTGPKRSRDQMFEA